MIYALPKHQSTLCDVSCSRVFDTDIETVFAALSEPTLVRKWLTPEGGKLLKCDIDFTLNGEFDFECLDEDHETLRISGVYIAIDRPYLIQHTEFCFPPLFPSGWSVMTHRLRQIGGKTELTSREQYSTTQSDLSANREIELQGIQFLHQSLAHLFEEIRKANRAKLKLWPPLDRSLNN